jgi:hypothetical protein
MFKVKLLDSSTFQHGSNLQAISVVEPGKRGVDWQRASRWTSARKR